MEQIVFALMDFSAVRPILTTQEAAECSIEELSLSSTKRKLPGHGNEISRRPNVDSGPKFWKWNRTKMTMIIPDQCIAQGLAL